MGGIKLKHEIAFAAKVTLFFFCCSYQNVSSAIVAAATLGSAYTPTQTGGDQITRPAQTAATACFNAANTASTNCHEATNPKIMAGMAMINTMMSASDVLSVNGACAKQSDIMNVAKIAMTGFTALCSGSKLLADSSCSTSEAATATAVVESKNYYAACTADCSATGPATPACMTACKTVLTNEEAVIASLTAFNKVAIQSCAVDAMMLASGAVGLAGIINKLSNADECKKQTQSVNCQATPNDPSCKPIPADCNLPANDSKPECICLKAPRTAGCPGATGANLAGSTMNSSQGSGTGSTRPGAVPDPNLSLGGGPSMSTANLAPSNSGGGGGGGAGSGAGGGGSGGRGADSTAKAGSAQKTAVNPNVLSGDFGGGGGGGGYRSSGGGSSSDSSSSAYKAYLPGGAKDPNRSTASEATVYKEVTGAGGADNWNKVSDRYRDNKPKMMGE